MLRKIFWIRVAVLASLLLAMGQRAPRASEASVTYLCPNNAHCYSQILLAQSQLGVMWGAASTISNISNMIITNGTGASTNELWLGTPLQPGVTIPAGWSCPMYGVYEQSCLDRGGLRI